MPWASYYWKLGKRRRRPDIGIMALEDAGGRICTHDQKDEIIVGYMKKIWAERDKNIEELDAKLQWVRADKEKSEKILNRNN